MAVLAGWTNGLHAPLAGRCWSSVSPLEEAVYGAERHIPTHRRPTEVAPRRMGRLFTLAGMALWGPTQRSQDLERQGTGLR